MRPAVLPGFMKLTDSFEGGYQTNFLYLDKKGLVTTAFGVLLEPVSTALACPWVRPDGTPASPAEITAEWAKVKARQDMREGGGVAYGKITTLRLTREGVDLVVSRKLDLADRAMRSRFTGWEEYSPDAQLFALSMCWAIGGGWPVKFPMCAEAFARKDFLNAAQEAHIVDHDNPGVKPRNAANLVLLHNASVVHAEGFDRDRLWYPRDIWEHPLAPDTGPDTEDEVTPVVGWPTVTRLPGSIANDDGDDPEAA